MRVRFGVIGLNHGHIYRQVEILREAGAEFVSFYAPEPELCKEFTDRVRGAKLARSEAEILEDNSIQIITGAGVPNERGPLAVRAMKHGKDVLTDKPGCTTLEQLAEIRRVQQETKRIYSIYYGRLDSRSTTKADELVKAGAIGRVIHVMALGPHKTNLPNRPSWFFKRAQYGGILCDIAAHDFDYFVHFANELNAEVVAAQVANYKHPEYPELEDFGDATVRGAGATGYFRVDWLTPKGLTVFGDCRLLLLGTDGFIEMRHCIDLAGRDGGDHLFLTDHKSTQYVDCRNVEVSFGKKLIADVTHRTATAQNQAVCFAAAELSLKAQAMATRLGNLK